MSAQFPAYSPVENGGNGGGRPKSYHPPLPRFYAPPTISTPPSDSLKPTPPTSYRHSHSLSTVFAGGPGQPPVNVRERSSSHSLYPAPYYPGGTSAPNGQAPQSRSRSGSYSPHPMQLQPGSGQSSSRQSLSPLDGAYPSAPNGQVQQARPRSSSHSPHPMALQPGSGSSSRPRSPSISGAPSDQPPQSRSRSGSYSPHPMQLQPGSRPSSRPHSPSLSFTGGDELHFDDPNPSSSPRQPSPTSLHAITSALDQATQQPSLHPQDADSRSSVSRDRSPSTSSGQYAPYIAPLQPYKALPQAAPAPMYPQQSPEPLFNCGYPSVPPPPMHQPPPPPVKISF